MSTNGATERRDRTVIEYKDYVTASMEEEGRKLDKMQSRLNILGWGVLKWYIGVFCAVAASVIVWAALWIF
jgi:hypothetical protein